MPRRSPRSSPQPSASSSLQTTPVGLSSEPRKTPDGRYLIVRGRLWRCTNPGLAEADRVALVAALMAARRDVGRAQRANDDVALAEARRRVHDAKIGLGERGPVWWTDGAPDENERLVERSSYADWWRSVTGAA